MNEVCVYDRVREGTQLPVDNAPGVGAKYLVLVAPPIKEAKAA